MTVDDVRHVVRDLVAKLILGGEIEAVQQEEILALIDVGEPIRRVNKCSLRMSG